MSALGKLSGRIGRSLVKYFNPIRTTSAHRQEWEGESQKQQHAKPKERARPDAVFKPESIGPSPASSTEISSAIKPVHSWLELVLFLLESCRMFSKRLTQRVGIQSYRAAVMRRTEQKIKTIGSIIDARPEYVDGQDEDLDLAPEQKKAA